MSSENLHAPRERLSQKTLNLHFAIVSLMDELGAIAGYVENGQPLDLTPAQDAAEAIANREEEFVYRGQPDFRLPGLLTQEGRQELQGGDWAAVERALGDVRPR